ncbi:MAG: anhydro-N-acetylmuramic acid kinase [Acidobacteria bacterium]|nr:anhydro-N-acetylmuramic acid kinase [Acidobacteriota bacterium]
MLVAGLMSGTSVDGIDVALTQIEGEGFEQRVKLLAFETIPYPTDIRRQTLAASNAATHTATLSQLNAALGILFGEAVLETCRRHGVDVREVELVGSHGQTIYHQATPTRFGGRLIASTLQIGEPAYIAALTGAPTVADFRPADMALGGQGAPLVPYVDYLLYRSPHRGRAALNIGGIANLTAIPPGAKPEDVLAFDTGPGNMLIDQLVSQFSRGVQRYDSHGRMAASGTVRPELLQELLADQYLRRSPPKSCGREQYGAEVVAALLAENLPAADLVATVTAFTAASIADSIDRFVSPRMHLDELIVSGGGVKNPEIMRRLESQLPDAKVLASDDFGVHSDAKEAMAFAILAHETWHGRAASLPSATGAKGAAILGKIAHPPPKS